MKLFFPIGAFYPSQIGGPCNTVYWHVKELEKHQIRSTVVTSMLGIKDKNIQGNSIITSEQVDIHYQKSNLSWSTINLIYSNIKSADLIHHNGLFNIPVTISLILWAIFSSDKKLICSVRGELNPNALKFSHWKKQPTLLLYRLLYKKILFHTTSAAEDIDVKNFFKGCKTVQIPNLMYPAKQIENIKKKKQFLFMGRIHEIKALHKFIKALALSKLFKDSDFIFDITGTHEDRHQDYFNQLKKMITELGLEEKVKFSGHITGNDKEIKYAESYFLILPSETENFGNVVVEALNQKTPVLASLGTPWGILEEYNCGIHSDNSPAELAKHIDQIISLNEIEYNNLCKNASKLVDDKFNITTQIDKWIKIYENLNHQIKK